jgi:hypothetical protein
MTSSVKQTSINKSGRSTGDEKLEGRIEID